MIIVIDAYNLIRAIPPYSKKITDKDRDKFISQLGVYGRKKGHVIVIVFDGGPYEWPQKEQYKTVLVVYSGTNYTADDYIKEYMCTQKAKDILLVSSDSELNKYAENLSIPSIDSVVFADLVMQKFQDKNQFIMCKSDSVTKMSDSPTEIDWLMTQATSVIPIKSEDLDKNASTKNLSKTTRSKKERVLLKKLNKL